jgi:Lon-like ATP-dependent protease
MREFKTTEEIKVPEKLIDQVIGQDKAVKIVKKAAVQRRHVMMLGSPGTGKSMLAQAMAELMPATELEDVLVYPNGIDENRPVVKVVKTYPSTDEIKKNAYLSKLYSRMNEIRAFIASIRQAETDANGGEPGVQGVSQKKEEPEMGQGRLIIETAKVKTGVMAGRGPSMWLTFLLIAMAVIIFLYATNSFNNENKWFVLAAILGAAALVILWRFTSNVGKRMGMMGDLSGEPKLIVDNSGRKTAPFIDATGSKAGALLGDVKHDPLQSGGLGTPAHLRVEAGAVHRSNMGVLFIDEVSSLRPRSQQELLTAMQEKKYSITGQSEMSSGAIVKTEPVPCDFVLVAAGNVFDVKGMHPALRSRIRGNGYEVYVEDSMQDTLENEDMIAQFVAQEVKRDGRIPHFEREAVMEILSEARRKAGRKKRLTLNLRELGGLVRVAGDLARDEGAKYVKAEHVQRARGPAQSLEQQMGSRSLEHKKDYKVFETSGAAVGKVNGLAVLGESMAGLVMPIVAEVTPASSKSEGKLIATGRLGEIAKEAVENVSAIIKKHIGRDVSGYDIHVQFLQTYEGVEGDSASISIAVAVISAMEGIPIKQNYAMTGSLSVRGEVLPVGGVTSKTEAAIEAGVENVIVPKSNAEDIYLSPKLKSKIKILPVGTIIEVLEHALVDGEKKRKLIRSMQGMQKGLVKKIAKRKARKGKK